MEQRIVTLDKVLSPHYAENGSIILEAYALYFDNVSKQCIAQLKLRNIRQKTINAVVVELCCFDTFNHKVANISYHYTRLAAEKNCVFGDKNAIALQNDKVSKFSVSLKAVSYADGSAWEPNEPKEFYLLPAPIPPSLEGELLEQYQRDLVRQGIHTTICNQTQKAADLWQCVCGSWQSENEACLACGSRQTNLLEAANVSSLELHLKEYHAEQERLKEEARLALEQKEKERRQQQEEEARRREQRRKEEEARNAAERARWKKIIISLASLLIVSVAIFLVITKVMIPNQKYDTAATLMNEGKYHEAVAIFEVLEGYRDSAAQINACKIGILDEKYNAAITLMSEGKYTKAITLFAEIVDHKDSVSQIETCKTAILDEKYNSAIALAGNGDYESAAIAFGELNDYRDAKERSLTLWQTIAQRDTIAAHYHTVALKEDGTVVAVGSDSAGACDVSEWRDIVAISAGSSYTIGLKKDGTVVAVGSNSYGQCNVSAWRDIVAVSAGDGHVVGLEKDGTVVAVGSNSYGQCNVSEWQDIVAISADAQHTVGLKKDGTVVAVGWNEYDQCDVSKWRDIVAVSTGDWHTIGLKKDGTVVAVGWHVRDFCDVSGWRDIIAVSATAGYIIGLKKDGTVVTVGDGSYGRCSDVSAWRDIVAVSAGDGHVVGLEKDGTMVAAGWNDFGQCLVDGLENIQLPH